MLLQSAAETVLRALMAEAIARAIDAAVIAGAGVLGAPQGVLYTSGIGTQSGASLGSAGLRTMRKTVLLAGAREDKLRVFADPASQEVLSGREHTSGGGAMLWARRQVLDLPATATTLVPANTLLVGDFSRVTVVFFDASAIEVEYDPFTNFKSGVVQFRLIVPVDVVVSPAAAFCVASSVS